MRLVATVGVAALWFLCQTSAAQETGAAPRHDPIGEHLLPPELIMQHQKAIALTDSQKSAVIGEIKRLQGRVLELQWDLQRAMERLAELLGSERADEPQVMTQLDNVLAIEREIKRAHLGLGVRLKSILTPEQQRMLRELRASQPRTGEPAPRR